MALLSTVVECVVTPRTGRKMRKVLPVSLIAGINRSGCGSINEAVSNLGNRHFAILFRVFVLDLRI
jgi:hypothetical protein